MLIPSRLGLEHVPPPLLLELNMHCIFSIDSVLSLSYNAREQEMILKKWVPRRAVVPKSLGKFKFVAKNAKSLRNFITRNKTLHHVVKKVFSKSTLKKVAIASVVGIGVQSIMSYIDSNSGCFLKGPRSVCKVKGLSCCQKDEIDQVPFCNEPSSNALANACENFDEDVEKSCCRLCDCEHFGCLPGQSMECQRPTVAEAITHFAGDAASTLLSGVHAVAPWLWYVLYGVGALIFVWVLVLVKPFAMRVFSRRKQDDSQVVQDSTPE